MDKNIVLKFLNVLSLFFIKDKNETSRYEFA
jgi:hypothetical protein